MAGPIIAITMGDPAGVGPETIIGSWATVSADAARRVVVGRPEVLRRAVRVCKAPLAVVEVDDLSQIDNSPKKVFCLQCGDTTADLIKPGTVDARAGQAALDAVNTAVDLALHDSVAAVVTAPINKLSLSRAGCRFAGHTELIAARCQTDQVAMMLYLPKGPNIRGQVGLGVVHVTLHTAVREVSELLNVDDIVKACRLAREFSRSMLIQEGLSREPHVAVSALNPHAGESGLFGREEIDIIEPAVRQSKQHGLNVTGPLPCDSLMPRAAHGEFDVVIAMYHDQGHIALKLLGMHRAINITLGLPIVRTSAAHGTAFDIAWQGRADVRSMKNAVDVAIRMAHIRAESGTNVAR